MITSSSITVKPLGLSSKEIKSFIDVFWVTEKQNRTPHQVAPLRASVYEALDVKKNPFYKRAEIQLFIAELQGKPVGRIAAIDNHGHREFYKDTTGFFGFFECINDQRCANALFEAAQAWLKQRGLTSMRGPVNPSTNHECGLLVDGFDSYPTLMTTHNPPFYADLFEAFALRGVQDLVAYDIQRDKLSVLPEKLVRVVDRVRKSSRIVFRDFNMKDFSAEVDRCFEIYNSAWEKNWGFFPMTYDEFKFAAKDMKLLIDPRMAFIAEVNGKPAGFMLALPDLNEVLRHHPSGNLIPTGIFKILLGKSKIKAVRIITLGVKPEYRGRGIFPLFTMEAFERAHKFGYNSGEASWILADNTAMTEPWEAIGAPVHRRWRIYEKSV